MPLAKVVIATLTIVFTTVGFHIVAPSAAEKNNREQRASAKPELWLLLRLPKSPSYQDL